MTVNEFFSKYNGKFTDYDGYYGNQCMDLYRQYVKECLEYPQSKPVTGAADVWSSYLPDYYERIENTIMGVPQEGDIVIWNKNAGGGFGHIAIYHLGDINNFISFDQNWPVGSACHFQNHNYTNVLGWLRPKKFIEKPTEIIKDEKTKIELGKIGEEDYGIQELQAIRSLIGDKDKLIKSLQTAPKPPETTIEPIFTNSIAKILYNLAKSLG